MEQTLEGEQKLAVTFAEECSSLVPPDFIRLVPRYRDCDGKYTNVCNSGEFQTTELVFNYAELLRNVQHRYASVTKPEDRIYMRARPDQKQLKYRVIGTWKEFHSLCKFCHSKKLVFPPVEVIIDISDRAHGNDGNSENVLPASHQSYESEIEDEGADSNLHERNRTADGSSPRNSPKRYDAASVNDPEIGSNETSESSEERNSERSAAYEDSVDK